jgi:hypothetical protein
MEICELVKVIILNATGTTLAVAQSAILIPPLEAGCASIRSQQSSFLLLYQPASVIMRLIVERSTLNSSAISLWLFSPDRIILIASAYCGAESV